MQNNWWTSAVNGLFLDTLSFIGKKAAYALSQNVKVIACIGELLEEREAGKTFDALFKDKKPVKVIKKNSAAVTKFLDELAKIGKHAALEEILYQFEEKLQAEREEAVRKQEELQSV
eukprot:XP_020400915.1 triosephosphate isomerase [Zea mays]